MNREYVNPKVYEVVMSSKDCMICNSETFSCYLSMEERNLFLASSNSIKDVECSAGNDFQ